MQHHSSYPLLHASFWHVQSLILRVQEFVAQPALVEQAGKIASILSDPAVQTSPLCHHLAALAGSTIAESAVLNGAEGIASQATTLAQALSAGNGREGGWEQAINNFVLSGAGGSSAMMGLQGLAEAAVGEGQAAQQVFEGGFDATKVLKEGYLNLFAPKP